jgi:hypothetical protein
LGLGGIDDRFERKFADLQIQHDLRIRALEQVKDKKTASVTRLDALERMAASFEEWQPGIEGVVDDI